ncbi:MAG TPA: hypothetical protein VGM81_18545 [Burkholderiaceae bacterium]|jgi:hypothetical protein
MQPSLNSRSFKAEPVFVLSPTVLAVFNALPAVIFYKAIRQAFFSGKR